jgi:hypothetical protein
MGHNQCHAYSDNQNSLPVAFNFQPEFFKPFLKQILYPPMNLPELYYNVDHPAMSMTYERIYALTSMARANLDRQTLVNARILVEFVLQFIYKI